MSKIHDDENEQVSGRNCHSCGYPTVMEYGIELCYHCGWSWSEDIIINDEADE